MKRAIAALAAAGIVVGASGCATIIGTPTHVMPIASTPSDADIVIADETGVEIFKGKTPTNVTLAKSNGHYWGGKSYTVTIRKEGFKEQTIKVASSPNGWYLAGNLLFGGLIGWFVVDPLNGSMYSLSPEAVNSAMAANQAAHNNTATDGSIAVMLIQDVPASLRDKMVKLN